MRFNRNILSLILLVSALAYTLWFVFAGFGNHQDPLYWLYKYEHMEGGWMAVGTLLTGGAVVRLFGAQLLPLRLFGWLCTVAAIALPYACLLTPGQRRENLHWLALTYVLMGYGAFQEFSPGTLSVLLLSAVWVLADKERNNPSASWGWGTAILAGLAVAARFPEYIGAPRPYSGLEKTQPMGYPSCGACCGTGLSARLSLRHACHHRLIHDSCA